MKVLMVFIRNAGGKLATTINRQQWFLGEAMYTYAYGLEHVIIFINIIFIIIVTNILYSTWLRNPT